MQNRFTNAMRERLKFNKLWIYHWEEYFFHQAINEKTSKEMGKDNPIAHLLINIYFIPTNVLKFLSKKQDLYRYKKVLKETEYLEKALNNNFKYEKKLKK
tara:strand:+ start:245 stop:544 length:300 start_codon:yes stop_codon:yes gene_type:complete